MKIGLNSPAIYFIAMGAVALLTAVAILSWIVRHSANIDVVHSADVLRDHWSFGRWGLIAGTLYWIPTSLPFIALPIANDVAASGYLKALMNVIMPAYQFNTAMAVLLLPALATTTRSSEHLRLLAVFALVLCLTSIGYASVIIGYGEEIFAIIYGGIYVARPMDIWLLSLLPLAHTADSLFDASLRAMMRPGLIAFGRALAAAVALTLGIALIFAYGTRGAIAAIVSAQLFFSLSIAIIWYRAFASETVNKTSSIEHDAKAIET